MNQPIGQFVLDVRHHLAVVVPFDDVEDDEAVEGVNMAGSVDLWRRRCWCRYGRKIPPCG